MHLFLRNSNGSFTNWVPGVIFSFISSVSLYLSLWNNLIRLGDIADSFDTQHGNQFDFIVVGSGSAGSVVANRLSVKYRVLLLEAGGDPHPFQYIPSFATGLLNHPEVDWSHKTTSQKNSLLAMNDRKSIWNQGRSLGGTSNINYMIQSRGNPMDYNAWANITGDDAWNYENLLPYFKKHEDFVGRWSTGDVHGTGGDMRIAIPSFTGIASYFIKAGEELGYIQDDLNGRYTEGFDFIYAPIKNGRRHGTYKAFIKPILRRPNLVISRFSHVNKLFFRGINNEAFAVEYDRHGEKRFAYASKEIILSAGAVKSPQILMLSGIGPSEQLEQFGIPVKKDLPVGQNVHDHLCTYLTPFLIDKPLSFMVSRNLNPATTLEYASQGTGPYTNVGSNAQAFIATSKAKSPGRTVPVWPDIQLYFVGMGFDKELPRLFSHAFNLRRDIAEQYYAHALGSDGFSIFVSNARPLARGEITLLSSDPYSSLRIEPNYLNNDHDMEVTLEGVYKALELVENTTAFQSLGARFTNVVFPGCEHVPFRSDEYFKCYIRHYTVSLHHISGSCSMGKKDSSNAVVDSQLKVIGTKGLRVIDNSIIPLIPVGNTNAVAVMIGEKGADLILQEWGVLGKPSVKLEGLQNMNQSTTPPSRVDALIKDDDPFDNWVPVLKKLPQVSDYDNLLVNRTI